MTEGVLTSTAALIGRLFYSSMYLVFTYVKLSAYPSTLTYMTKLGLPAPSVFVVVAIIVEFFGGLLILVGYRTRLVALGLTVYVLVTAFLGHFHLADAAQLTHFMKNMAIVGGALAFVAFGAGAYSLDGRTR